MTRVIALTAIAIFLAACGDSADERYDAGYDEGYEAGAYEVCRELRDVSDAVRVQLRTCRGL